MGDLHRHISINTTIAHRYLAEEKVSGHALSEGPDGLLPLHGACGPHVLQVDVVAPVLDGDGALGCLRNECQRWLTRQFHHLIDVALCSGEPLNLIEVLCRVNMVGIRAFLVKYLISESIWVETAPGGA